MNTRVLAGIALILSCASASAQGLTNNLEFSFYTGMQGAPHSRVSGSDPGGLDDFSFLAGWEGNSFQMPPYYGFRATWWRWGNSGFGVELNHAKVYADDETFANNPAIEHFEFSDGLNILTVNYAHRWPEAFGRFTPYVIGGVGVSIPHVELTTTGGGETFEYQLAGPAVEAVAGLSYAFNERWSAFGEYKFTYSMNKAELDNGGSFETNIITNALNIGVAYHF